MNEYEYESTLSDERGTPAPEPGHIPAAAGNSGQEAGPQCAGDPPHIVSRMPDLGSGETEIPNERPRRRRRRSPPRKSTLSSKTWTWIGMGSMSVVLIAVALFWNGEDSSESPGDERAAWELKSPAPDAPMAPVWGGAPAEGTDWQNAAAGSPYQQPGGYASSPSFSTADPVSQPPSWDDPSQVSSSPSWAGQQEASAWGGPTQTPAGAPQSPWDQTTNPNYPNPQGYAGQQPTWQSQPNPSAAPASSWPAPPYASAGEHMQAETSPWGNDTRSTRMAASSPRTAMAAPTSGYTPTSPPTGFTAPYVGQYQAATPAPAYYNSQQNLYQAPYQQPSAAASPPPTTGSLQSGGFRESYAPRPQDTTAAYPTDATSSVARRNGYQTTYPQSTPNTSGTYPSNSYRYGSGPTTGTSSGYGSTYRGTSPSPNSSSSTYPSSTYPASRDSSSYPTTAYPSTSSSSPPASYTVRPGTGVSTPYPQSGTARLNGVIEMASPRTSYDRSRLSLY